jgi:hypothetical protein
MKTLLLSSRRAGGSAGKRGGQRSRHACGQGRSRVWGFDQAWRSDASGVALLGETSNWVVLDGGAEVESGAKCRAQLGEAPESGVATGAGKQSQGAAMATSKERATMALW